MWFDRADYRALRFRATIPPFLIERKAETMGSDRRESDPSDELLQGEQGLTPPSSSGDTRKPPASSGDTRKPPASSGDDR